ncbi:MAG: AraC family transcriptional regulator [Defluviitaleaceae bacterium]|nr:AraC family transcriptional regulator [Defluviitaleaceae bacterium]
MKFESSGIFIADEGWKHPKRVLESFVIIVVIGGTLYMEHDGECLSLTRNDLCLLLPGVEHNGYDKVKEGTSFYWAHFTPRGNFKRFDCGGGTYSPDQNDFRNGIYIPTSFLQANLERIIILCNQLCHINESRYLNNYAADYAVTSLLVEVSEQFLRANQPGKRRGKLEKILEWIRVNADRSISLSDVAHEFNYSKEYLSRYFHKMMGITMLKYINRLRIAKAKELLSQGDWQIKEISKLVGIRDDKYFLRLFKEYVNLTPEQFRNAYNKTHYNKK